MPILSRLLLAFFLATPLAYAVAEPVASAPVAEASAPAAAMPSKDEVIKAIAVLEKDFLGDAAAGAAQTVMQFAEQSKDVTLQVSAKTTPWVFGDTQAADADEDIYRQMLLVAYIAGNMQTQIASGKAVDNPLAGWKFVLKTYQIIQKANSKVKLAELETLKSQSNKGQLEALAKKALQK